MATLSLTANKKPIVLSTLNELEKIANNENDLIGNYLQLIESLYPVISFFVTNYEQLKVIPKIQAIFNYQWRITAYELEYILEEKKTNEKFAEYFARNTNMKSFGFCSRLKSLIKEFRNSIESNSSTFDTIFGSIFETFMYFLYLAQFCFIYDYFSFSSLETHGVLIFSTKKIDLLYDRHIIISPDMIQNIKDIINSSRVFNNNKNILTTTIEIAENSNKAISPNNAAVYNTSHLVVSDNIDNSIISNTDRDTVISNTNTVSTDPIHPNGVIHTIVSNYDDHSIKTNETSGVDSINKSTNDSNTEPGYINSDIDSDKNNTRNSNDNVDSDKNINTSGNNSDKIDTKNSNSVGSDGNSVGSDGNSVGSDGNNSVGSDGNNSVGSDGNNSVGSYSDIHLYLIDIIGPEFIKKLADEHRLDPNDLCWIRNLSKIVRKLNGNVRKSKIYYNPYSPYKIVTRSTKRSTLHLLYPKFK